MVKLFFAGVSIAALAIISVHPTSAIPISFSDIPEPLTMLLLGTGLVFLAVVGKKRFSKKG